MQEEEEEGNSCWMTLRGKFCKPKEELFLGEPSPWRCT